MMSLLAGVLCLHRTVLSLHHLVLTSMAIAVEACNVASACQGNRSHDHESFSSYSFMSYALTTAKFKQVIKKDFARYNSA